MTETEVRMVHKESDSSCKRLSGWKMTQEALEQDIPIVQKNVAAESKNGLIVNKRCNRL